MECNFCVGQQVECISDAWRDGPLPLSKIDYPIRGNIYTIREIFADGDLIGLIFHEIKNPSTLSEEPRLKREPGFNYKGFRALDDRKTDTGMAILKKLLQPKHERV